MTEHPWALLPIVENNQGLLSLLSLLALVAALVFFLLENRRTNRAQGARQRDYVVTALGLIDRLTMATDEAVRTIAKFDLEEGYAKFLRDVAEVHASLVAIRPAAPPDAQLVLSMTTLIAATDASRLPSITPERSDAIVKIINLKGALKDHRQTIEGRKPAQ